MYITTTSKSCSSSFTYVVVCSMNYTWFLSHIVTFLYHLETPLYPHVTNFLKNCESSVTTSFPLCLMLSHTVMYGYEATCSHVIKGHFSNLWCFSAYQFHIVPYYLHVYHVLHNTLAPWYTCTSSDNHCRPYKAWHSHSEGVVWTPIVPCKTLFINYCIDLTCTMQVVFNETNLLASHNKVCMDLEVMPWLCWWELPACICTCIHSCFFFMYICMYSVCMMLSLYHLGLVPTSASFARNNWVGSTDDRNTAV